MTKAGLYTRARAVALAVAIAAAAAAAGCGDGDAAGGGPVVIYVSVDREFAEPVLADLGRELGLDVRAKYDTEETKSTGLLNELVALRERPKADLFWCGDTARAELLRSRGVVEPWRPVSLRGRVLLVHTRRLPDEAAWPRSVEALADPRFRGTGAMASPVFGTMSVHAAALFARWGDERARAFFEAVKANGTRILGSNGDVRRAVATGEAAFGLLDTDDAETAAKDGAPVALVWPDQGEGGMGVLLIPNAVAIVRGGPHPEAARRAADALVRPAVAARLAAAGAGLPGPPPGVRAMEVDVLVLARKLDETRELLRAFAATP